MRSQVRRHGGADGKHDDKQQYIPSSFRRDRRCFCVNCCFECWYVFRGENATNDDDNSIDIDKLPPADIPEWRVRIPALVSVSVSVFHWRFNTSTNDKTHLAGVCTAATQAARNRGASRIARRRAARSRAASRRSHCAPQVYSMSHHNACLLCSLCLRSDVRFSRFSTISDDFDYRGWRQIDAPLPSAAAATGMCRFRDVTRFWCSLIFVSLFTR